MPSDENDIRSIINYKQLYDSIIDQIYDTVWNKTVPDKL